MERSQVLEALTTYKKTESKQKTFIDSHWKAREAMQDRLDGVPLELMEAFYEKDLSCWPEVAPQLDEHSDDALVAYGRVAPRFPDASYAAVLTCYARGDAARIRRAFHWLRDAHAAMASQRGGTEAERQSIREAAADADLVACLRSIWERFGQFPLQSRRPIGWAAILLREGSPASVALLKPYETVDWDDEPYDHERQDLYFLRPESPTPEARAFLEKLAALLHQREDLTGQHEWFRALGLAHPPESLRLQFIVPTAKGGQEIKVQIQADWRSTALYWFAAFGKVKPVYAIRTGREEINKKGMPPMTLAGIPDWMRSVGAWKWDEMQFLEEGFDPPIRPVLEAWLRGLRP